MSFSNFDHVKICSLNKTFKPTAKTTYASEFDVGVSSVTSEQSTGAASCGSGELSNCSNPLLLIREVPNEVFIPC